jgi:hypothetical protein
LYTGWTGRRRAGIMGRTPPKNLVVTNRTKTDPPIPKFGAYPDAAERLRRIVEEQGVAETANVEHLEGCLEDLWESDEEFEQFLNRRHRPPEDGAVTNTTEPTAVRRPPPPMPDAAERLQRIAEAQGVADKATVEHLRGDGSDLWETDEEFERFLEHLRESRRRG